MALALGRSLVVMLACAVWLLPTLVDSTKIRLSFRKHSYEGQVEVFLAGRWRFVSEQGWGLKESRVVCRMLGFPGVERYLTRQAIRYRAQLVVFSCTGKESDISECTAGRPRRGYLVAGVSCLSHERDVIFKPEPSGASAGEADLEVRLLGPVQGDFISEGQVQVKRKGRWGFICPTSWGHNEARVVCGQLGFPDAQRRVPYEEQTEDQNVTYWMDAVQCTGVESALVSCDHKGWGPHTCPGNRVVRVTCVRFQVSQTPRTRLRSGAQVHEGRVEVKTRTSLSWGTVCDDNWDLLDGSVVCRSLGFGSAAAVFHRAHYGQGVGKIHLDDVACTGWERDVWSCRERRKRNGRCENHYEDAGVKCHAPELQGHKIRLRGGKTSMEGSVEVYLDGRWGAVCADDWHIDEAMVACRQLGLGFAQTAVTDASFETGDSPSPPVVLSAVDCRHDERSLLHCQHQGGEAVNCSSATNRKAGVVCVTELPDLVLGVDELLQTLDIDFIPMNYLICAREENCLGPSASKPWTRHPDTYNRRLLRFTASIENRGLTDFRPHASRDQWQWHECHNHFHSMEEFTHYDLISMKDGSKAAVGHKASFCLEDARCDGGVDRKWNCSNGGAQGISPNCFDIYRFNIDCQWIDLTDVRKFRGYYFRVHLNPGRQVAESNFKNNIAKCEITDRFNYIDKTRCRIEECESGVDTFGGNAFGACCQFPFRFKGKLYNSCIKTERYYSWCATTFDYQRDRKWGRCYV